MAILFPAYFHSWAQCIVCFKMCQAMFLFISSAPRVASSNTSTSIRGTNKMGRKLSSALLTQSLNHMMSASPKLRRWYERLAEYKKAGPVRMGLRRRVLGEIYQHTSRQSRKVCCSHKVLNAGCIPLLPRQSRRVCNSRHESDAEEGGVSLCEGS